jgi:hypothetical protein
MTKQPNPVVAGWRLLWRTQGVLWWLYAVNLVLGFFSAAGVALRVGGVLDHSLAAERLYHGFDLAYFYELAAHPDVQLVTRSTSALLFASIFFVFMLFATGGILETYLRERRLGPGEFFQGCGALFWRFVRLLLWLAAVLVFLLLIGTAVRGTVDRLIGNSPHERLGFLLDLCGLACAVIVLMIVRLWFDMAQVCAAAEDERAMLRTLVRAFRLTFSNFGRLFGMYFGLCLFAWAGTIITMYIWVRFVPAERIGTAFLLGQLIAWLWLAVRLWQRASEVVWYQRQRLQPEPASATAPLPTVEDIDPPLNPEFTPPET